jgi:endo-1,4-beta-xylanase
VTGFSRREALGAAAAAALLVPGQALAAAPGLDAIGKQRGIRFGTCLGGRGFQDERYRALIAEQCGLIVPENELKWQTLRPDAKTFDFARADALIAWAKSVGLGVRGHTLLWQKTERYPKWLVEHDFGTSPRAEAERLLTEHVSTVAGRYAGVLPSFDVVNEAVDEKTGALRETVLTTPLGAETVIDIAFRTARASAPNMQLVYNDYMSWEPGNELHRSGVLKLLEALKKRGTPVDALGIQSHIGAPGRGNGAPFGTRDEKAWRAFLDAVTGMGLKLLVTEMDVNDKLLPTDIVARDRAVADYAKAFLDSLLAYPQLDTILFWGLADKYSWLQGLTPRPDGLAKRCCPYGMDYEPKPIREAVAAVLRGAAQR